MSKLQNFKTSKLQNNFILEKQLLFKQSLQISPVVNSTPNPLDVKNDSLQVLNNALFKKKQKLNSTIDQDWLKNKLKNGFKIEGDYIVFGVNTPDKKDDTIVKIDKTFVSDLGKIQVAQKIINLDSFDINKEFKKQNEKLIKDFSDLGIILDEGTHIIKPKEGYKFARNSQFINIPNFLRAEIKKDDKTDKIIMKFESAISGDYEEVRVNVVEDGAENIEQKNKVKETFTKGYEAAKKYAEAKGVTLNFQYTNIQTKSINSTEKPWGLHNLININLSKDKYTADIPNFKVGKDEMKHNNNGTANFIMKTSEEIKDDLISGVDKFIAHIEKQTIKESEVLEDLGLQGFIVLKVKNTENEYIIRSKSRTLNNVTATSVMIKKNARGQFLYHIKNADNQYQKVDKTDLQTLIQKKIDKKAENDFEYKQNYGAGIVQVMIRRILNLKVGDIKVTKSGNTFNFYQDGKEVLKDVFVKDDTNGGNLFSLNGENWKNGDEFKVILKKKFLKNTNETNEVPKITESHTDVPHITASILKLFNGKYKLKNEYKTLEGKLPQLTADLATLKDVMKSKKQMGGVDEINAFLKAEGVSIRLDPIGEKDIAVASVLTLKGDWAGGHHPKSQDITLENSEKTVPGVKLKNTKVFNIGLENPVIQLDVVNNSNRKVYISKMESVPAGLGNLQAQTAEWTKEINSSMSTKKTAIVPQFDFTEKGDIKELIGTKVDGGIISQAKYENSVKLSTRGFTAKAAGAASVPRGIIMDKPAPTVIVDGPLVMWVVENGVPAFATHISSKDMKNPVEKDS